MADICEKMEELGVIPVVVLNDVKDAVPLAKALVEGGIPCAEVTFRTAAAEESIREIKKANFQEIQSVFTDEQKKELEKIKQERKKEIQKRHKDFKNSKETKKFDR